MPASNPRAPRGIVPSSAAWAGSFAATLLGHVTTAAGQDPPPPPAAVAPADPAPAAVSVQRLKNLETSDGVQVAAWYYPARAGGTQAGGAQAGSAQAGGAPAGEDSPSGRPAIVMLLHDLDGSHTTVEPLAKALQQRGIAVVVPDLRGHGASKMPGTPAAGDQPVARPLKKADLEAIVRSTGGQVRDQALVRGEVEVVYQWIRDLASRGGCDLDRLFVIGSGVGGALAAHWVVADASWPALASGPQGGHVRGLVLVSPAWTTRGFSLSPALGAEPIARSLPLLVLAGGDDDDAVRLCAQLKRLRPDSWYEKRVGQAAARAPKLQDASPTIYLMELDSPQSGDALASQRSTDPRKAAGDPAGLIAGFISTVSPLER